MNRLCKLLPAGAVLGVLLPGLAQAQSFDSGDTAWIMTATALVLFMTLPGLALFYGGLVRSKNVLSVLMQCFAICCVISIVWLVIGFSMAFSGTARGDNVVRPAMGDGIPARRPHAGDGDERQPVHRRPGRR
jgi:hypothetical protein